MNRATTLTTHSQRLAFEREQSERKSSADIALAQQKLGLDREFAAWKRRTIPRGFESCSHRHGTLLYSVSSVFASIPEFLGSGSEDQDHIREGTEGSNLTSSSRGSVSPPHPLSKVENPAFQRVGAAGLAGRAVKNRSCGTRLIAVC
jgi:hypothetical protein